MGKRKLEGQHTRVEIPQNTLPLPRQARHLVTLAYLCGVKETDGLLKRMSWITEQTFCDDYSFFESYRSSHPALGYLCTSMFQTGICCGRRFDRNLGRIQKKNLLLLGIQARLALSKALLLLTEEDRSEVLEWWKCIKVKQEVWYRYFFGSLAIARLAFVLDKLGATVYWPRIEDAFSHRIHLVARVKGHSESLCMMVSSDVEVQSVSYSVLSRKDDQSLSHNERRLRRGVLDFFRHQFQGVWEPVAVSVSSAINPRVLLDPEQIVNGVRSMLEDVITDFAY